MPDFEELLNLNSMSYEEVMEKLNKERKEFLELQSERSKTLKKEEKGQES